jgi:intracellular multiplication protein IcmO
MGREGVNFRLERKQSSLLFDTRNVWERLRDALSDDTIPTIVMSAFAASFILLHGLSEYIFLLALAFYFYARHAQRNAGLALRVPKSSGQIDPKEISLKTKKPAPAEGISYLGNCMDTGEEVWETDVMARTHKVVFGTTGSGKTESLISLIFNSFIHGSGLIYVDGKADSSLYGKIYSMARAMGREDDVLVINFQTGAKDIYGAQSTKLSNTLNPFANGSSGMLSELIKGLMATGENSTWTQQAESFVEALMKPLVYLRDRYGMLLDVNRVRDYFELDLIEDLAWTYSDKYPGLEESGVLDGIRAYLKNKPGYKREKFHDQSDTTHEQHGYISMQLMRTFNSLADTYGYIMKTPLAEIDFVDVFLNRRILIVLLPALEKAPSELTNLGRIVVASLKATMAKGLGSTIEGEWAKIIDAKPTAAPSPFQCVLDEYGYYSVEGFAVVPAQARSLGFGATFAGQDLPAFQKSSREEAESTLANTNTRLCGKLECTKTFEFFSSIAGKGIFTKLQSYESDYEAVTANAFKANEGIAIDHIERVRFDDLRGQASGQWHLFFANTIIRLQSFFANPKTVKHLRVNHFVKVARPTPEEVEVFKATQDLFTRAVSSEGGLVSFMDRVVSPADILEIRTAWQTFGADAPLLRAGKVLAYCAQAEAQRSASFTVMTAGSFDFPDATEVEDGQAAAAPADAGFDFVGQFSQPVAADAEVAIGLQPVWGAPEGFDPGGYQHKVVEAEYPGFLGGGFDEHAADAAAAKAVGVQGAASGFAGFGGPDDELPFQPSGSDYGAVLDGAIGGGSADDLHAGYGDGYGDGFGALGATPARAHLLGGNGGEAELDQTNIFGFDGVEPPAMAGADDGDGYYGMPETLASPDGEEAFAVAEFDAPAADQGLLSRDVTVSGLAAIEVAAGAPELESQMTAHAVATTLAEATTYPMSAPSAAPAVDRFEEIAGLLLQEVTAASGG